MMLWFLARGRISTPLMSAINKDCLGEKRLSTLALIERPHYPARTWLYEGHVRGKDYSSSSLNLSPALYKLQW